MKKILLFITALSLCLSSKADEGMWLPILLKQLNEADMQLNGSKLSADDIYSINKTSLKDAVVLFGAGCTGEVISHQGLVLTNHHCGISQIQSHSTISNDYLKDGFWAMSKKEELPNPGLSVTFIVAMEDVTAAILKGTSDTMSEINRDKTIKQNSLTLEKEYTERTGYGASVKSFYNGNQYYIFTTETFKDVRLVGAPPSSIGKYGSDTDNWMWPRHSGDFSLFRIYADKNNKPAEYSADNVPYQPKFHFTISLNDVQENDFTMVYGFPGRTTEYISSYAVKMIREVSNPIKIKLRTEKLAVLDSYMRQNDTIRIKYSAKHNTVSNAWKKWIGENKGLDKLGALAKKAKEEELFLKNAIGQNNSRASTLLVDLELVYSKFTPLSLERDYYMEAFNAIELMSFSNTVLRSIAKIESAQKGKAHETVKKEIEALSNAGKNFYKNFDVRVDRDIFKALIKVYYNDMAKQLPPELFSVIKNNYNGNIDAYANFLYGKSHLTDWNKFKSYIDDLPKSAAKIKKDEALSFATNFNNYFVNALTPKYSKIENDLNALNRKYMQAQLELITTKKFYPDANSTLRVAYGKVSTYKPFDGVQYNYYTTLEGVMEKENPKLEEFVVHPKLKSLFIEKDYGRYADKNGKLRIDFIASNHTTGGNSGSPVLNKNGELIGTNFDRNWEGTMSDIMYNPDQVRNIIVDSHYTLFIIDKFAGAKHLIEEMTIVN